MTTSLKSEPCSIQRNRKMVCVIDKKHSLRNTIFARSSRKSGIESPNLHIKAKSRSDRWEVVAHARSECDYSLNRL